MPGSGKSTLGRRIAAVLGMEFVDTDRLLERRENMSIQAIVNRRGLRFMRRLEEDVLTGLNLDNHVISTGGSAVYSSTAMDSLGNNGVRVYLQISLPTLMRRVVNETSRGLVKMPSFPLARLYHERVSLYEAAADITISNNGFFSALSIDAIRKAIRDYNAISGHDHSQCQT